jgi:hypothetical protein
MSRHAMPARRLSRCEHLKFSRVKPLQDHLAARILEPCASQSRDSLIHSAGIVGNCNNRRHTSGNRPPILAERALLASYFTSRGSDWRRVQKLRRIQARSSGNLASSEFRLSSCLRPTPVLEEKSNPERADATWPSILRSLTMQGFFLQRTGNPSHEQESSLRSFRTLLGHSRRRLDRRRTPHLDH